LDRRKIGVIAVVIAVLGVAFAYLLIRRAPEPIVIGPSPTVNKIKIKLPEPRYDSNVSIEEALLKRRSIREDTG